MSKYRLKVTNVQSVQWNGKNTEEVMEMVGHRHFGMERRIDSPLIIGESGQPQTVVKQYEFVIKHEDGSLEVMNAHSFENMFEKIAE